MVHDDLNNNKLPCQLFCRCFVGQVIFTYLLLLFIISSSCYYVVGVAGVVIVVVVVLS